MNFFFSFLFFIVFFMNGFSLQSQEKGMFIGSEKSALEGVIVEKYYIADVRDISDTLGGSVPKGSTTYRIYIDMKQGYFLQAM